MTNRTVFRRGSWDPAAFEYIYSPKFPATPRFVQQDDCIVNGGTPGAYEYISLITRRTFRTGTLLTLRCSFEKYGAPLIVLTDDVRQGEAGELRFGRHMEIVAYEGGVNVWKLTPLKNDVRPENLLRQKFPVPAGKPITLTVRPGKGRLDISLGGNRFSVEADCVPEEFHAGMTACEGINRFYEFSTDEPACGEAQI